VEVGVKGGPHRQGGVEAGKFLVRAPGIFIGGIAQPLATDDHLPATGHHVVAGEHHAASLSSIRA